MVLLKTVKKCESLAQQIFPVNHYYAQFYHECSIRVYQLFNTIFHKCLILLLIFILHFPVMLALCLILSMTHFAQNYADIIGRSLFMENSCGMMGMFWLTTSVIHQWCKNIMEYLHNNHVKFKNIVCIAMCFLVSYSNYLKWNHVRGFLLKYVVFNTVSLHYT